MDAKEIDDNASGDFVQVFFGPPSSKTSAHSSTNAETEPDDPGSSLTWRVPVTSLQVAGFKYASKAMTSDSDRLPSALTIHDQKCHCKRREPDLQFLQVKKGGTGKGVLPFACQYAVSPRGPDRQHPLLVEGRPNCARQSLASALSALAVAARHRAVIPVATQCRYPFFAHPLFKPAQFKKTKQRITFQNLLRVSSWRPCRPVCFWRVA